MTPKLISGLRYRYVFIEVVLMKNPPEIISTNLDPSVLPALESFPELDSAVRATVQKRWNNKTKPLGSLGLLEELVLWVASARADVELCHGCFALNVYAGSHGVVEEGVSLFPNDLNALMLGVFNQGGSGINALCDAYAIDLKAYDAGIETPTANIAKEAAMSAQELAQAFNLGWNSVPEKATLFAVGEMGIGNTTIAAALIAAILGERSEMLTGAGTGIDAERKVHKAQVIQRALDLHAESCENPWELLRCLGGRELAAMVGAILRATSLRIPVMLDGVIATAAAAVAFEIQPRAVVFCRAGHRSVEPAHIRILERYGLSPLLDLGMRLGEGTGAAMAMGIVRGALRAYRDMCTFADLGLPEVD